MSTRIDKIATTIYNKPASLSEIALIVIFTILVCFVISSWIVVYNNEESKVPPHIALQTPLLVLGISGVGLIAKLAQSRIVLTVALLVLAAGIGGAELVTAIGDAISPLEDKEPPVYNDLAKSQIEELPQVTVVEDIKTRLEAGTEVATIQDEIRDKTYREIAEKKSFAALAGKPTFWSYFLERWEFNQSFKLEIDSLITQGIVTWDGEDYNSCKLSVVGEKIKKTAKEKDWLE